MAIAKLPKSNQDSDAEKQAQAFIAKSGKAAIKDEPKQNRLPKMVRIPPELLKRIDQGAERLGISRSAFIVQSAAEKLERMDR